MCSLLSCIQYLLYELKRLYSYVTCILQKLKTFIVREKLLLAVIPNLISVPKNSQIKVYTSVIHPKYLKFSLHLQKHLEILPHRIPFSCHGYVIVNTLLLQYIISMSEQVRFYVSVKPTIPVCHLRYNLQHSSSHYNPWSKDNTQQLYYAILELKW